MEESGLVVFSQMDRDSEFILKAYAFTDGCGWLDVVTLEGTCQDSSQVTIKGKGESTGFLPLMIPLSPILNCLLCWMPFQDWGNNQRYLNDVWTRIRQQIPAQA